MRFSGLRFGKMASLLAALAIFAAGCSDSNEPEGDGQIRLENEGTIDIYYVYFRACGETDWGSDQLGSSEIVDVGEDRVFDVPAGCYDLLAEDIDFDTIDQRTGIDIDEGDTFTWTVD